MNLESMMNAWEEMEYVILCDSMGKNHFKLNVYFKDLKTENSICV